MKRRVIGQKEFSSIIIEKADFVFSQLKLLNDEINADWLFVASVDEKHTTANTLCAISGNHVIDNFSYPLKDSPCEKAIEDEVCCFNEGVAMQFPKDIALQQMGISGYLGIPILNSSSHAIGILVGLFKRPQADVQRHIYSFKMAAAFISEYAEKIFLSAQRVQNLNELEVLNNRLNRILNNLNESVITANKHGIITHSNKIALSVFGYSEQEFIGLNINKLMPEPYASRHNALFTQFNNKANRSLLGDTRQLPAMRKNGDVFQIEIVLTESYCDGESQYIAVIRDISEQLKAQDTIYSLAYIDEVSGLKNKQWFKKELEDLILRAKINRHYICIAILDIDNFARFNRKYGFDAGNEAIKQISNKISALNNHDVNVYKCGANSFFLLSAMTKAEIDAKQDRNKWLSDGYLSKDNFIVEYQAKKLELTASIGCCICEASRHSFESINDTVEYALARAKLNKPSGYFYLDEEGSRAYERVCTIKNELESVTEANELRLVLQPQFDASKRIVSSEALLRWDSKRLGIVEPSEFIKIAEESDAIIKIGDWVLNKVFELLVKIKSLGLRTRISVNISGRQIMSPDFYDKLMYRVKRFKIAPDQIRLELTETALVSDIELVKNVMFKMQSDGFTFSIDDFGTGYSSLNYLKELPLTELKIDKCFVDEIQNLKFQKPNKIVDLILDVSRNLNVSCVAEGIETKWQAEHLKAKNCAVFQGYYFSKPLEVKDWINTLNTPSYSLKSIN